MNKYIFILGNHPKLSIAEIESYFNYYNYKLVYSSISSNILLVNTDANLNQKNIINDLGGTVKIASFIKYLNQIKAREIVELLPQKNTKLKFGLSFYNFNYLLRDILRLNKEIKFLSKEKNIKLNFVLPKNNTFLSSAQVFNKLIKNGIEFIIIKSKDKYLIFQTIEVQNINLNTILDYGIPFPNPVQGMLPYKLVKIMINLCLKNKKNNDFTLLDPFCGSGRIAMEALLKNINIYASDINQKSINDTNKNVSWILKKFNIDKNLVKKIFLSDATKPLDIPKVDAIVTEPYLGNAYKFMPEKRKIINEFNDLAQIYLKSFKNFKNILKSNSKIICVFPVIGEYKLSNLILDKIEQMGYHKLQEFNYSRKYQIVKRQIFIYILK